VERPSLSAENPKTARGVSDAAVEDEPPPSRRPSAPALMLNKSRDSKAIAVDASAADERVRCEQCNVLSPKDYRFCVGCGSVLPRKRDVSPAALANSMMRNRRPSGRPGSSQAPASEAPSRAAEAAGAASRPLKLESRAEAKPAPPAAAPPAEEVTGRLVVIVEDGSEGTSIDLRGRQMDIGSVEGSIILEEDRYLSPRHARLFRQDEHWYLRDLESLNGVYRRLRKPAALRDGDLVLLGLEVLQFNVVDHAERGLGHAVENGVLLFGSPATPRRARLSQRTVEGITRDVYHLISEETTIGRENGDIVFTGDPFMSRRHAMVKWNEASEEYVLSDLSSSNGTYLAIRDDVRLENGDFVRLGQHLFRVDLTPNAAGSR